MNKLDTNEQHKEQRQQLRRKLQAHRDALTAEQLRQAETDLLKQLQSSWASLQSPAPGYSQTQSLRIAGYLATGGEISLDPSLRWLRKEGHTTYLPVVKQQHLMFAEFDSTTQFTAGKYNIDIPVYCEETLIPATQLDVVLLPLVGFDLQGGRLGMGGGYYDRSFAFMLDSELESTSLPNNITRPILLGVAHEFQRRKTIPVEHWDVPLTAAITDQANYTMP